MLYRVKSIAKCQTKRYKCNWEELSENTITNIASVT